MKQRYFTLFKEGVSKEDGKYLVEIKKFDSEDFLKKYIQDNKSRMLKGVYVVTDTMTPGIEYDVESWI